MSNFIDMKIIQKFCSLFIIVLLLSPGVIAQNAVIDSLKNELSLHPERDTVRVRILNAFAYKHYGIAQDTLLKYAEESIELADEIGFYDGGARAWYLKSIFHLAKGDLENASTYINKSLVLYEKADNLIRVASCYDLMGTISMFREEFDASIGYYQKALKIVKEGNDPLKIAGTLTNIGGVLSRKGDYDSALAAYKDAIVLYDEIGDANARKKALAPLSNIALDFSMQGRYTEALEYYQKCLTGYREHGNKVRGSSLLLNIGLVYSSIEEHDKAVPYLLEALDLAKELGNDFAISKALVGLGTTFQSKKEYEKAEGYYQEALSISNKTESNEGKHNCYINIGSLQLERKDYNSALVSYKKALESSTAHGGKREMAESYTALGKTYYHLNDNKNALANTLKGRKLADELSILKTQQETNLLLSKLYQESNNYKEALTSFKAYKDQSDSLLNKESIQKITQLEYDYKYKQALDSASIRELKLTKTVETTNRDLEKSQRNYLLAIIGFLLIGILLAGIIFYQKFNNIKSKNQNIVTEQRLLRSQMTPHFIFNSLSVLQGMILNKEEKKSISYLSKFSKLLRIILENSRDTMVSLSQELEAIDNYLALQNLESEAYQYTISVDDNVEVPLFEIPPMLIQPFVENAIEHAFPDQKEAKIIEVDLSYIDNDLICTVTDNGIGVDSNNNSNNKNKTSLATTITSERLKKMAKDFKMKGSVTIKNRMHDGENGTIVTLVLPYKISEKV